MTDARDPRAGAHAGRRSVDGSTTPASKLGAVPLQRADSPVEVPELPRSVPISSGASASRPTSTQAAFRRTLRALAPMRLPVLERPVLEYAEPRDLLGVRPPAIAAGIVHDFALDSVVIAEPAYAAAVDWMLCAALASLQQPGGSSYYFRVTSRAIDQQPFEGARERLGDPVLRRQLLTGAYRLVHGVGRGPSVQIAAVGPTLPEAVEAAAELESQGIAAHVVDVVSADAVFTAWQRSLERAVRTGTTPAVPGALRQAFDLGLPLVTVHDRGPASLAWLGAALGVPTVTLGAARLGGRSATAAPVGTDSIVSGAIAALSL